jgi:hypothetical protein
VKAKPKPEALLKQIAAIQEMERGKLCRLRDGTHHNHQTWEKGRNVVRYVPRERIPHLQKAISGYQKYTKLTKAYADAVIQRTRLAEKNKTSAASIKKTSKKPIIPKI